MTFIFTLVLCLIPIINGQVFWNGDFDGPDFPDRDDAFLFAGASQMNPWSSGIQQQQQQQQQINSWTSGVQTPVQTSMNQQMNSWTPRSTVQNQAMNAWSSRPSMRNSQSMSFTPNQVNTFSGNRQTSRQFSNVQNVNNFRSLNSQRIQNPITRTRTAQRIQRPFTRTNSVSQRIQNPIARARTNQRVQRPFTRTSSVNANPFSSQSQRFGTRALPTQRTRFMSNPVNRIFQNPADSQFQRRFQMGFHRQTAFRPHSILMRQAQAEMMSDGDFMDMPDNPFGDFW